MPETPNTIIEFYNVPWDAEYRNIRWFASKSARDSWFEKRSHFTYPNDSSNVTHAQAYRYGDKYTVSPGWDAMHRYNYMRFKNRHYPQGEWTYCFIDGWHYVSEHSCEFTAHYDAYVNNVGEISFQPSYVVRCHTTGDRVTYCPEPISINRYVHARNNTLPNAPTSTMLYVLYATNKPQVDNTYADLINTLNGAKHSIWILATYTLGTIKNAIKDFSKNPSDIICIMAYPEAYVVVDRGSGDLSFQLHQPSVSRTTGTFEPKNNKCLTYPFCYCQVTDFQGQTQLYKWEDGENGKKLKFQVKGNVGVSSVMELIPAFTHTSLQTVQNMIHPFGYAIGYSIDGSSIWFAQNAQNLKAQQNQTYLNMGVSAGVAAIGLGATVATGGAAAAAVPAVAGSLSTAVNAVAAYQSTDIAQGAQMANANAVASPGAAPDGSMQYVTNSSRYTWQSYSVYPCTSEFSALDDFFTKYGYALGTIAAIDPTRRSKWWYCQTQGATVRGNAPQDDRLALAHALDRGVTFWHTDDIGDYSGSNP